ncbi:hypothetical protein MKW92_002910 [Papaver armeniacum]|nr:hypothetical protein MKW92_002910 [Papaver armeniacum]
MESAEFEEEEKLRPDLLVTNLQRRTKESNCWVLSKFKGGGRRDCQEKIMLSNFSWI